MIAIMEIRFLSEQIQLSMFHIWTYSCTITSYSMMGMYTEGGEETPISVEGMEDSQSVIHVI